MRFTKMHGIGNDYVYLDCTRDCPSDLPKLAVRLSDRHFGVGGDGLICVCPSQTADFRMRMFNADGSEGEMCGNGIRCVGKLVWDRKLTDRRQLAIETGAGVKLLSLKIDGGQVSAVTVDMGEPRAAEPRLLAVQGREYLVTPVDMGNPHVVLFLDEIDSLDLAALGPCFERHPAFPNRTNTEFVRVASRTELDMRVWERGSGETLACGTGACAALTAAVLAGKCARAATLRLRGGNLSVRWDAADRHIYMTGPAITVFEGELADS